MDVPDISRPLGDGHCGCDNDACHDDKRWHFMAQNIFCWTKGASTDELS